MTKARAERVTHVRTALRYLARSRRARVGLVILGMLALVSTFAELLASSQPILEIGERVRLLPAVLPDETAPGSEGSFRVAPPLEVDPQAISAAALEPPSRAHPLGTDERGRDVAALLIHGARGALGTSLLAVVASLVLGLALGALAGSGSARWNKRLERLVEAVDTFPVIVAVAVMRAIEEQPSAWSVAAGVALVKWAEVARIVRAEVLRLSLEDFVLASRALGATRTRTLWRHLLPHTVGPVAVCAAMGIASVTLLETAVSFLGLGPPTSDPSWGQLLAQAARNPERPAMLLAPSILIMLTVGAAFLLADALRDATDPHAVRLTPKAIDGW